MSRENVVSFVRFCIVGCINTAISLAVYYLLLWLNCHYLIAITLGYIVSSVSGYFLNKVWVFGKKEETIKKSIVKYYLLYGSALLLNLLCMTVFIGMFHFSDKIAPILTIIITTIYNYVLSKVWVFGKTNKIDKKLLKNDKWLIVLLAVFSILVVFMFVNNAFIHPIADDYSNMNMFMDTIPEGKQDNYSALDFTIAIAKRGVIIYKEWQGTYFSNFLFFASPLLISNNAYKVAMFLIQVFWLGGTLFFFRSLPANNQKEHIRNLKLYLLFIIFCIMSMYSLGEGVYWFTSAVLYIVPFTLSLILYGLILRDSQKSTIPKKIVCFILAMLLAGTNYTTGLFTGFILLLITTYKIIYKKPLKLFYLSLLIVFSIGFCFNVFCPGNFMRIDTYEKLAITDTLKISGVNALEMIRHLLFGTIFVPILIAAIPSLSSLSRSIRLKNVKPVLITVLCLFCFFSFFLPMAFSYGSSYQETRVENIQLFYLIIMISFLIAMYLKKADSLMNMSKAQINKIGIIASVVSIIMISAIGTENIAGFWLIDDVLYERSYKYSICMDEIEDKLSNESTDEVVLKNCDFYPPSQHYYYMIKDQWQIYAMEEYFNKKIIIEE